MAELNFDRAVKVARDNVQKLVPNANNITLEEAMTSSDGRLYEVTFSYEIDKGDSSFGVGGDNFSKLASLMGRRREYKIFLVDADNYSFRGFRNYKET